MRRFIYVQGTGRRKHLLFGNKNDPTVCGAWYFGHGTGKHNRAIAKTLPGAPVCKNCLRRITAFLGTQKAA